jgi:hypothetical protein
VDLREYESAKFALADVLRTALSAVPTPNETVRERAQPLFARLAEDRFNLVVIGRYSRGKTSLMNAVLGTDRLPMGLLPLTSVITSVTYGSEERVRIEQEDSAYGFEIPMSELPQFITEQGNPGNVRRVRVAHIFLPSELLRRGFHFVDTPGLDSSIAASTRTTKSFLPEADAIMLVSGYEAPLSSDEMSAMDSLREFRGRLFLALNKQDMVPVDKRGAVQIYARERLAASWSGESPMVFSTSARDGLAAKLAGDEKGLRESGLAALEEELARFLLDEKGHAFITSMHQRIVQFVQSCPIAPIQREALERRVAGLAGAQNGPVSVNSQNGRWVSEDLRERRVRACELCARINDTVIDFLRQYQFDLATKVQAQDSLAEAGGLCAEHLRLYAFFASDRGVCLALTPLLKRWALLLHEGSAETLLSVQTQCALCELQCSVEASSYAMFAQ